MTARTALEAIRRNGGSSAHATYADARKVGHKVFNSSHIDLSIVQFDVCPFFSVERLILTPCPGDGVQMPGNKCSNCIAYSFDCTYVETAKVSFVDVTSSQAHWSPRNEARPKGKYAMSLDLEIVLKRTLKLRRDSGEPCGKARKAFETGESFTSPMYMIPDISKLCPDEDSYKKLTESLDSNWMSERPPADPSELIGRSLTTLASGPSHYPGKNTTVGIDYATTSIRHAANEPMSPPDVEDETTLILADNLQRLELEPSEYRFFGKSSGAMLIHAALELKSEYTGSPDLLDIVELSRKRKMMKNLRSEFWTSRPVGDHLFSLFSFS